MFDISVIVTTYNPDMRKLFATLNSIIIQEKCNYQIIIADDCSNKFDENIIKKWMKKHGVTNYKIIRNKKNEGTVKNVYNGVNEADSKMIKLISPGDFLYDSNTLSNVCEFMQKNKFDIIFGKSIFYSIDENKKIHLFPRRNPMIIKPYIKKDNNKIKKNYLINQDFILGASFVCKKELLIKYLSKILDKVIYTEDSCVALMIADGIQVNYWNNYLVWYEFGSGISTNGNTKWFNLIKKDQEQCYKLIVDAYPKYKNVYDLYYSQDSKKIRSTLFILRQKINRKYHNFKNKIIVKYNKLDLEKLNKILNYEEQ